VGIRGRQLLPVIKRVDLTARREPTFGNPAPLGLMGLAVACFATLPLSFGLAPTKDALLAIAIFAFFFGGCCQLLTGLMDLANKNAFGGAVFTLFSFGWMKNALVLVLVTQGVLVSSNVDFATDVVFLVLLLVLSYGFGFFSKLLFLFLLDIDFLYLAKIINHLTHSHVMDYPLGISLALLGLISMYVALAALINPVAGRAIFPETGPMFRARYKSGFDWTRRFHIFGVLYEHWRVHAYAPLAITDLQTRLQDQIGEQNIRPDLDYLQDYGSLVLAFHPGDPEQLAGVRLTADGIDLYEQLVLKKYEF